MSIMEYIDNPMVLLGYIFMLFTAITLYGYYSDDYKMVATGLTVLVPYMIAIYYESYGMETEDNDTES